MTDTTDIGSVRIPANVGCKLTTGIPPVADPAERATERAEWARKVGIWLDSPAGNGIPADHVVAILADDQIGPWMDEMEAAGSATLVIDRPTVTEDDGKVTEHGVVAIHFEVLDENPMDWLNNDRAIEFSYCPLYGRSTGHEIASIALGICYRAYWPSKSEKPTAWKIEVVHPLGYKDGDHAYERFAIPDNADPAMIAKTGM